VRNSIANLLSLPQLEDDGFADSYQTGGKWIVTTTNPKEIIFHRKADGICCGFPLDMHSTAAMAMVQTIRQRYEGFTKCKVLNTTAARKAQAITGHPSNTQFNNMMRDKTIKICPAKPNHIANAHAIFGSSIAGVHRKTICCKPKQVEAKPGCIPDDFHHLHQFVVLTADIMFVSSIAFLTTLSC
jgi:hypothetical protein